MWYIVPVCPHQLPLTCITSLLFSLPAHLSLTLCAATVTGKTMRGMERPCSFDNRPGLELLALLAHYKHTTNGPAYRTHALTPSLCSTTRLTRLNRKPFSPQTTHCSKGSNRPSAAIEDITAVNKWMQTCMHACKLIDWDTHSRSGCDATASFRTAWLYFIRSSMQSLLPPLM